MLIGFSRNPSGNPLDGSDSSFLQLIEWNDLAPKKLVKAARKGDVVRFVLAYRAWLEPFAARFRKHVRAMPLSLLPESAAPSAIESLIAEFGQPPSAGPRYGLGRVIVGWVRSVTVMGLGSDSEHQIVLELLLNPPIDLEIETWCRLWRLALVPNDPGGPDQVSSFEAGAIAGLMYGPLLNANTEYSRMATQLGTILLAETDNDGTPQASALRNLGAWLAPFVRAGWWGKSFKQPVFVDDAADRFRDTIARSTECIGADGSFVFDSTPGLARTLLPLAARTAGWSKKTPVGRAARFISVKKHRKAAPLPSSQSDWAMTVHMRTSREANADLVAIAYDQQSPRLAICMDGRSVALGDWAAKLKVSGKTVPLRGEWSCSCWHADEDGDYVELEQVSGSVKLVRQVFLSRSSRFVLLMDSVRTAKVGSIRYQSSIPLAQHVMARADFISREWRLHTGTMPVRVFPASLAFDRVQSCAGNFHVRDGSLVITAEGKTSASTALVLDWQPSRTNQDAEWTRLTVTENRTAVALSEAAAFRVRIGDHQIVSYRNTGPSTELRAVLGQHTARESMIGLLKDTGKFEPLVLVDADGD